MLSLHAHAACLSLARLLIHSLMQAPTHACTHSLLMQYGLTKVCSCIRCSQHVLRHVFCCFLSTFWLTEKGDAQACTTSLQALQVTRLTTGCMCVRAAAEEAARSAASRQARGWQASEPQPQDFLPEPDLLALQLSTLKQLLLEAAAFGCMLWESERAVQNSGYQLTTMQATLQNTSH